MTITPDSIPLKRCSKGDECVHPMGCMQPATLEYFGPSKQTKDGFFTWCRICRKADERKKYTENPVQYREKSRQWRVANPDKQREVYKRSYIKHAEEKREYSRRRRASDIEKARAEARAWRASRIELARAWERQWYAKNRHQLRARKRRSYATKHDAHIEARRRWRISNPNYGKEYQHKRRARERELLSTLTTEQWKQCLEYWHNTCAYCGAQQDFWHVLEQEHFIPVMKGGGYTADNIIPSCKSCNSSKCDTPPVVWLNETFGRHRAKRILARINAYFEWIKEQP